MEPWQSELRGVSSDSKTPEQLFQRLVSAARHLGFEYCAYGTRLPLPLTKPRTVTFNNYPAEWRRRYQERDYQRIDPTVHFGARFSVTMLWSDELFVSVPQLWKEAQSFGLRHGWSRSSFDSGGVASVLTLARSADPLCEQELRDKSTTLDWLTHTAHTTMAKCLMQRLIPECTAKLSAQELTVLRWTGEGYCSREIGQLMNIAERTVNFHVTNATAKLNASNKTAAVMRAAVLGLLH
jgi:LuxR family transcriptional regulator